MKSSQGRVITPEGSSERGFFGNRKGTKRRRFAGRPDGMKGTRTRPTSFDVRRGDRSERDNTERKPFDYSRIRNRKPPIDVSNRREERAKFKRDRKNQ